MNVFCWKWRRQLAAIVFGLAIGVSAVVYACNVPVFRFALERWRPDPYRVTLVHRGELTDAQKEIIRTLEDAQDKGLANLMFRIVEASDSDQLADDALLIVQYPEHLRIDVPVWKGPLSRENVQILTDSPVRRELVRRLAEGQTAVWLLLESGQPEKDDAAAELLNTEFKRLEQELKLPELTSDPADELLAATPLKVAFSVLRVPHAAASEQALAGMLINCESDLAGRSEPIVYPVFGRGRVLLPLIGAGITAKNIEDSAAFLVGPCSCQVKELNPGFDLLLSTEWDALLSQNGQQLTAFQTRGLPLVPPGKAELVPIPSGAREATPVAVESIAVSTRASGASWLLTTGLLGGAIAFVVLLAALNSTRAY